MNEHIPSNLEGAYDNKIWNDPVVSRIYDKAKEFNELFLTTSNMANEEYDKIIQELDAEWPYMNVPVKLSGPLTLRDVRTPDYKEEFYADLELTSNGFIISRDPVMFDDEIIDFSNKIKHKIHGRMPDGTFVEGIADLDKVAIEYPFSSAEHTNNLLCYHHAELMEEIDYRIMNTDNEIDATMSLANLKYDAPSGEIGGQFLVDTRTYFETAIQYDERIPYITVLDKSTGYLINEDGGTFQANVPQGTVMAGYVRGVMMYPSAADGNAEVLNSTSHTINVTPHMIFDVESSEMTTDSFTLMVPAHGITSIQRIRDSIFQSIQSGIQNE